jgi:hypothetical protein
MATCSCIFITAAEARNSPIRDRILHDEHCGIESAILDAVKLGYFEATVSDGTPMTESSNVISEVWTIDPNTDQLFVPNHGFKTGDTVQVNSTITLPAPLVNNAFYYVIYIDDDHIKLASSFANAKSCRPFGIDVTSGITSINLTNQGSGYIQPPVVTINGGGSNISATATAFLAPWGSIVGIANTTNGSGYSDLPTVQIVSQGSGASAGAVQYGAVGVSINTVGSNYRVGDILSVSGGTGTPATAFVTSINSNGAISSLTVSNSGVYTALPSLSSAATTVLPAGGIGATVNLTIGIVGVVIAAGGTGYTAAPRLVITDPSGVGATGIVNLTGGSISSVVMTNPGHGYVGVNSVAFDDGSGATAIASMQPVGVNSIVVTNSGTGTYTNVPTVNLNAVGNGASSGATYMKVVGLQLASSGNNYTVGDTLIVSGGIAIDDAWIRIRSVDQTGRIVSYSLEDGGKYSMLPGLISNPVNGGTGTFAGFNLVMGVDSVNVAVSGTGYAVPPVVAIEEPILGGVPAIAVANIINSNVSSYTVRVSGSGYTSIPNVTVSNGSDATATAMLTPTNLNGITVTTSGTGYTTATVTLTGGGATTQATAIAGISGTSIANVTIISPGSGYTSIPTVTITGDGAGAVALASLVPTQIQSIAVTNGGSGYNLPPTVTVSGAGAGYAVLESTGIDRIIMTNQGSNYTSDPFVYIIPGSHQIGTPIPPIMTPQRGFSVSHIELTNSGSGYQTVPTIVIADPQIQDGISATATATIGAGSGTFILKPYPESRDYFKAWKNLSMSNGLLARPYVDRMDAIISYFTSMGYVINRITNPATNTTFSWKIQW